MHTYMHTYKHTYRHTNSFSSRGSGFCSIIHYISSDLSLLYIRFGLLVLTRSPNSLYSHPFSFLAPNFLNNVREILKLNMGHFKPVKFDEINTMLESTAVPNTASKTDNSLFLEVGEASLDL